MLLFNPPPFAGRTFLSDRKHGTAVAKSFDNKKWCKINAQINWVEANNTSWTSMGSSDTREHLLFDESSPIIEDLKTYVVDQCQRLKGNIPAILKTVNNSVNLLTKQIGISRREVEAGLDKRLENYIKYKMHLMNTSKSPVITMDELIQHKILVCRHKGPLAACLLAELVRKNILPKGTVRQYRSQIQHGTHVGVHTWAVYRDKQSNDLWMCDPRWNYVQNVTRKTAKAEAKGYGVEAIQRMLTRLKTFDQAEFERLDALSESSDSEDSSYDEVYDPDIDAYSEDNVQVEKLLNAFRQQQPLSPIKNPTTKVLQEPEYNLDFLNDNLQEVYDRIQRENSPMRQFMRNVGKSMSNKGELRVQTIRQLESLLLDMYNNQHYSNFEKALIIYESFHRVQLAVRNEQNRFQSSLDDLCTAYKRKIINIFKSNVDYIARLYALEEARRDDHLRRHVNRA